MSNANVGTVYDSIIKDVIETSRVDFEESGVDEGVLEELRKVWQEKLTTLQVAQFPWDPKPEPSPASQPAPNNAPNPAVSYTNATLSPPTSVQPTLPMPAQPMQHMGQAPNGVQLKKGQPNGEPAIKQEPGTYQAPLLPQFPAHAAGAGPHGALAMQRAAQNLQQQYGAKATASIQALQSGPPAQGQRPQMSMPMPGGPGLHQNAAQFQQQQQQAQQQQLRPVPHQPQFNGTLGTSQVDGSSDDDFAYEGVLMRRGADGETAELGRVEVDRMLHGQMAAMAKRMEGGGMMLPLRAATKHGRRRGAPGSASEGKRSSQPGAAAGGIAQLDGVEDGEEDEDAINSDLDDPEEEPEDSDEENESMDQQMLCLYDKVQRVKNKWKCTLKDGILTVNGKEYVFHKATGEYEW